MGYFQMARNIEEIFGGVVVAPHQIPFTYTSTNGGETFLSLPFYPITGFVTINSGVQVPIENFELDGNTLYLGRELEAGDVVFCLFDKIMSPQDASNNAIRIYKFLSVGGETEFTPDFTAYGVQSLFIDGRYKVSGEDYNYFKTSNKVVLDNALATGVWVVAEMNIKQNIPALAGNDGASQVGTSSGENLQTELDMSDTNTREQWRRQITDVGLNLVEGSFEEGAVIQTAFDAVWFKNGGQCYIWNGSFPKSVPPKSSPQTTGGISSSGWGSINLLLLSVILARPDGAQKSGYRYGNVYSALSRLLSYQDYNLSQQALGRDATTNQLIWDAQIPIDLKHRGGVFAGKETFGIRENSTVASFRANTGTGSAFVPQVAGSDDLAVLAQAGALDSVAVFADVWLGEYNSWEDIATADYTATSFTVNDVSLLEKVKVGQYLITKHPAKYVGLVTGISGTTVTVQKWVSYGTTTVGTPANGVGLYVNPIIKGWAFNGNVLIGPNSRAQKCALMELGLQNNGVSDLTLLTGSDVVLLDGTYGGGDAYRARGSNSVARWDNNYHAYAATKVNFRSSDGSGGSVCAIAAFYEESASAIGMLFAGKNTSRSLSFNNTSGVEQTALAPYGFEIKGGKGLSTAVSGTAVSPGGKVVVQNSSAFALVLPDATTFTAGREIHFIVTGVSPITITSSQSGGTVNGNASIIITPTYGYSEMTATYAGGGLWYITR